MAYCNRCYKDLSFWDKKYGGICRNCYEKEERRKQEQEERENERNHLDRNNNVYKHIQKNLSKYGWLIYLYNKFFSCDISFLNSRIKQKYNTPFKLIKKIIDEFCVEIKYREFSLENIINTFSNNKFFNIVIAECMDNWDFTPDNTYIKSTLDIYMKQESIDNYLFLRMSDYALNDNDSKLSNKEYNISYTDSEECRFFAIYHITFILLYATKFCDYFNDFEANEELSSMHINLLKQDVDIKYIIEKLYNIYENCYISTFDKKLDKDEFKILLILEEDNLHLKSTVDSLTKYFIPIKSKIQNGNIDEYYKEIDINGVNSILNESKSNKSVLLCLTLFYILGDIQYEQLLEDVFNANKIYNNLEKTTNEIQAQKDKERFLNGDFSKEEEMQKQAVEYSNVQTGYEFEEYVANLYRKLGYTIEEVTKKSGDQRCRCCGI